MIASIIYFILWLLIWCGLCWPVSREDLVIGVLVSMFITYMTVDLATNFDYDKSTKKYSFLDNLKRVAWLLYYLVVFLWECTRGNIDVAYRVLHPDLHIRPGTVMVKVSLRSDIGLTFLANSITLTPGTTTVDVDKEGGYIYIHWIYVRDDALNGGIVKLPLVEKFESILKKVFE
jgi:multicomponent Na+:H+ antiporter subunit E